MGDAAEDRAGAGAADADRAGLRRGPQQYRRVGAAGRQPGHRDQVAGRFLARRLDGLGDEPRPGGAAHHQRCPDGRGGGPDLGGGPGRRHALVQAGAGPARRRLAHQRAPTWRAFGLQPWRTEDFKISPDPLLVEDPGRGGPVPRASTLHTWRSSGRLVFRTFPSPRKTRSGWPGPPRHRLALRCGTPWWTAPAFRGRSAAACQRVVFAELSTDAMIATGMTGKPAAARWIVESVVAVIRNAGWKRCCGCRCFPPGRTPKPAWPELEVQHAGLRFSYPS
jgi:hypothetical protein